MPCFCDFKVELFSSKVFETILNVLVLTALLISLKSLVLLNDTSPKNIKITFSSYTLDELISNEGDLVGIHSSLCLIVEFCIFKLLN